MQRLAWDKGLILNLCRNKLLLVLVKVARSVIVRRQLWRLLQVQDKKCAFNNKMFILPSFCVCVCVHIYILLAFKLYYVTIGFSLPLYGLVFPS